MTLHKFILNVKNFPELYEKKDMNYMNNPHKEEIWEKLSTIYKFDARKKWTGIRDKYVREKKKQYRHFTACKHYVTRWEHYPTLSFLDSSIKPRGSLVLGQDSTKSENVLTSQNSCDSDSAGEDEQEEEESRNEDIFAELSCEENDTVNDYQYSLDTKNVAKYKSISENDDRVEDEFVKTLQVIRGVLKRKNDEDDDFLKLIGKKMAKMTPQNKSAFQIEMFTKVEKILNGQNSNS